MNKTCDNYFDTYGSKSIAWEQCQDIYWMLVMLDDSGYSNSVESVHMLRQYACQIARSQWNLLYLDLRKAIEIVEKTALSKQSINRVKRKINSLIMNDISSASKNANIFTGLKLAKSAVNPDISSVEAASLTAVYALKLGANHATLAEHLRNFIGNPYVVVPTQIAAQHWWVVPPKARNIFESIRYWLNSWLIEIKNREERRHFNNFMNQCVSLAEAWSSCPNPNWMITMIDMYSSYNDVLQIENKLRQFVCYLAQQKKHYDLWRSNEAKMAIWTAERFINGEANMRDIKIAKIQAIKSEESKWILNTPTSRLALLCMSSPSLGTVVKALKLVTEVDPESNRQVMQLLQTVKLRELIENPFI